jgi:hypothetical protein
MSIKQKQEKLNELHKIESELKLQRKIELEKHREKLKYLPQIEKKKKNLIY